MSDVFDMLSSGCAAADGSGAGKRIMPLALSIPTGRELRAATASLDARYGNTPA